MRSLHEKKNKRVPWNTLSFPGKSLTNITDNIIVTDYLALKLQPLRVIKHEKTTIWLVIPLAEVMNSSPDLHQGDSEILQSKLDTPWAFLHETPQTNILTFNWIRSSRHFGNLNLSFDVFVILCTKGRKRCVGMSRIKYKHKHCLSTWFYWTVEVMMIWLYLCFFFQFDFVLVFARLTYPGLLIEFSVVVFFCTKGFAS